MFRVGKCPSTVSPDELIMGLGMEGWVKRMGRLRPERSHGYWLSAGYKMWSSCTHQFEVLKKS